MQIVVNFNEHRISWSITDEGNGFDIERVLEKAASDEPSMLASGRGVMMMKAFMDDVRYDRGGRRVHMTLRNPNAEQIAGLSSQDWDDLQQTFRPQDQSFDLEQSAAGISPQLEGKQDELNEVLEPLLASLSPDENGNHDQREYQRLAYTGRLLAFEAASSPRSAYVRNISQGGLCFLCESPFASRQITVELEVGGFPVRVDSEIVRCTELIPNVYDIGVRFLQTVK